MKHKLGLKFIRQTSAIVLSFCLAMSAAFGTAYDTESFKEEVSSHLINWEQQFDVSYAGNVDTAALEKLKNSIEDAVNAVPYVANNWDKYEVYYTYSPKQVTFSFKITYMTNLEMEKALDQKLSEALKAMNLKGVSDYNKVRIIADWISDHFSYDDSLKIHAASEMSEKGIGVCQAYTSMFYKMAKAVGLEVEYQLGTLDGINHVWNLVNIAGKWYHVDVTNYDANDRKFLMLAGTNALTEFGHRFTPPSFTLEADNSMIDKQYDNGLFDAALIPERLKISAYKSPGFTADYSLNKSFEALYKQMDDVSTKLLNQPSKARYNELRQLISKAGVLGLDTNLYSSMADQISVSQYNMAKAMISKAAGQIKVLKGSKLTEKSALAILKYVDETKLAVDKANILDSHSEYLNGQVSVLGKEAATYLMQSYFDRYKKTGHIAWLNRFKAINGKYGISMTIQ